MGILRTSVSLSYSWSLNTYLLDPRLIYGAWIHQEAKERRFPKATRISGPYLAVSRLLSY